MIDRLLIAIALVMLGFLAYRLLLRLHMRGTSQLAVARSQPTVLYFRSDTCGPCLAQGRYLQQLQAEFDGQVSIEKIDADVDQDQATRYGVFTLPTTLVIDEQGKVRHINYGLTDARRLAQQLQNLEKE